MQVKISKFEVEINENQAQNLAESLHMQLGRYSQIIQLVSVKFSQDVNNFGQSEIVCKVKAELTPKGQITAVNTSATVEESFYHAVSRAKRQFDRQHRTTSRQFTSSYRFK